MNGFLFINKKKDFTSRDVVNIACKKLGTKKIGHTGTLDPLATGVLILGVGRYTKFTNLVTSAEKEYVADVVLGLDTDTLDITGKILSEELVNVEKKDILKALEDFTGIYNQEVPIYSAVKVNGKKLYNYAREGIPVELPSKKVNISEIELLDYEYKKTTTFKFRSVVSKGTYIRSLIRDIAFKLGTTGSMSDLIRTRQGNTGLDKCIDIDDLDDNTKLIKVEEVLDVEIVIADNDLTKKIMNGNKLENIYSKKLILFKDSQSNELALYKVNKEDNKEIKVEVMLMV